MKPLAPELFKKRYQDLLEIGRALLPKVAPQWTDYNAHDPGIMLMEVLAFVAEAQLYSLSRLRRDERAAYARLLGIEPAGNIAAQGAIWPDRKDPQGPYQGALRSMVISPDTEIHLQGTPLPLYHPVKKLLWVPGKIQNLETRRNDKLLRNHQVANDSGKLTFHPFGQGSGLHETLAMEFCCSDPAGFFGQLQNAAQGAYWALGVLANDDSGTVPPSIDWKTPTCSPLSATFVAGDDHYEVPIAFDTTNGMLRSGVLLLELDTLPELPEEFTLELRCKTRLARAPRVRRIEPNVIPIVQGSSIEREQNTSQAMPNWHIKLLETGLCYAESQDPLTIDVAELSGVNRWERCEQLSDKGPQDNVYEFDARAGEVRFGNGINGRIPPQNAQVFASYSISAGEAGRVARHRKWKVAGFANIFGTNPDPIGGGADEPEQYAIRRKARKRVLQDHSLVNAEDLRKACLELSELEVTRAWVPERDPRLPETGMITLIAMRKPLADSTSLCQPETLRWLQSIRNRLAPRMLLGTKLVVRGPRYADFRIRVTCEAEPRRDPDEVSKAIQAELQKHLQLVETDDDSPPRQLGVPLTKLDLMSWISSVKGVKQIKTFELFKADGKTASDMIKVSRSGFPRWLPAESKIVVSRPSPSNIRAMEVL